MSLLARRGKGMRDKRVNIVVPQSNVWAALSSTPEYKEWDIKNDTANKLSVEADELWKKVQLLPEYTAWRAVVYEFNKHVKEISLTGSYRGQ